MKNNTVALHAKSSLFAGLIVAGQTLKGAGIAAVTAGGLLVATGERTEKKGREGKEAANKQLNLIKAEQEVAAHKAKVEKAKRQLEKAEEEFHGLTGTHTATINA